MSKDEIFEEIHKIREEHAKSFNYDLQAICDDLRRKQIASGRQIISQPLKRPAPTGAQTHGEHEVGRRTDALSNHYTKQVL